MISDKREELSSIWFIMTESMLLQSLGKAGQGQAKSLAF